MISLSDVIELHNILINKFGGSHGVRDNAVLESALARPFQTFDGTDLYASVLEKAASLVESILINHPFIDGNKRTGYALLRLFLLNNNMDLIASKDHKYEFIINIASGIFKYEEILAWLKENTKLEISQ